MAVLHSSLADLLCQLLAHGLDIIHVSFFRPEMAVFALKFGGFALSADTWI
jgi:hypothetical protein